MQLNPHGVMFHHFSDEKHCFGQGAISGDKLARMIEYLGRDHILSAEEWITRTQNGTLNDTDICLTFDDALLCQYEIALPVLQSYSITGFWFVYTSVVSGDTEMLEVYRKFRTTMFEGVDDFYVEFLRTVENSDYGKLVTQALHGFVPEKYLSDFSFYTDDDRKFRYVRDAVLGPSHYDQIMGYMLNDHGIDVNEFSADLWIREDHLRCLHKEGHIIGLHSHTHPMVLAELSQQEQQSEYENNFKILHKILDLAPTTMSHPNNSYNEITLSTLRELGICLGFRSNAAEPVLSELEFPRDDHATIIREMGN